MAGRPKKVPSYCRHKASGQAVVRINSSDHYLGIYGTPESHERYRRIIAEHFSNGQTSRLAELAATSRASDLTVVELIAAYWEFAGSYYVKNGKPTSEQTSLKLALRPLKALHGSTLVREFGPLSLEVVRERMIDANITRNRINQHVGRIRRMFKWGVSKELIPVTTFQSLMTVEGLRKGRSRAKESKRIRPVRWSHVETTLPFLPAPIQAMIQLQYLVGCRPGEITLLRPCDILSRNEDVWEFVPESHKTEHHERQRRIFIGKRAQTILEPWMNRDLQAYCFSPKESREEFDVERSKQRRTPHTPSSRARKRKGRPKKKPGDRYTTASYGYAIRKACKKSGVPNWSPNQLRHTRGTQIRRAYGLEASQVVLGHSKADVTQIYAERDFELAKSTMREMG
ncbi:MAG: site-specific integrase [Planctomycetaceae bacterium]|nr:site-specific integrase [Planctomycetaceae bacterium]